MTLANTTPDATVLVVDDDAATRRSVARLVRSVGFGVKTFASPAAFLRDEMPAGPTCVLLDMYMEGMTGLEVQNELRRSDRHVPVVFLSGRSTISTAVAGVRDGAEDFLEKPFRPSELIEVLSRALERDRAGSADRATRAEFQRRFDSLTPREQEVMTLVVTGLLNKQAAAELGITEKTIKVHRARVMEKMNVESLAELVVIAERLGLTSSRATGGAQRLPAAANSNTTAGAAL
jgi:FixJ family two-component response regulator